MNREPDDAPIAEVDEFEFAPIALRPPHGYLAPIAFDADASFYESGGVMAPAIGRFVIEADFYLSHELGGAK